MDRNRLTRRSFLAVSTLSAAALLAACAAPAATPTTAPATTAPAAAGAATKPPAAAGAGTTTPAAAGAGTTTPAAAGAATAAATKPAGPTATIPASALNTPTPEPTPALAQVVVKAGQTKIDWWTPRGGAVDLKFEQQAVNDYNASQDKIVVQMVYVPVQAGTQSSAKLLTAIAAGTPPNTAEFDRFIVSSWAAQAALMDLSSYAQTAKVTADQYWPFAWEEASYKGKLYAMPFDTDTRGVMFNIDAFKEAGLDPTKPPQTIAELDAAAEKLTTKNGRQFTRWGYSPIYNQSFHFAVCLQFAGPNFDKMYDKATNTCTANAASNVEAFTWIKSYADKYNIQDMEAFQSAFGTNTNDPFLTGQIGMYAQGDWGLSSIKQFKPDLNFGVTAMPGKTGPAPCMAGGWSEVIPKGAKDPDLGFQFLSYYAGKPGQLTYNLGTMHIPTNIEAAKDPGFVADPKHKQYMDFLATALNRPAITAGQVLWTELGNASSQVAHGQMTPQAALDNVKKLTDAELAKYP